MGRDKNEAESTPWYSRKSPKIYCDNVKISVLAKLYRASGLWYDI